MSEKVKNKKKTKRTNNDKEQWVNNKFLKIVSENLYIAMVWPRQATKKYSLKSD